MGTEMTSSDLPYLILEVYRPILREKVKFSHLVSKMPFMREVASKILKMDRSHDFENAAEIFFEHLASIEEEGKFTAFMDALEQSGYNLIMDAIRRGGINYHHEEHKRLLELFTERLSESIDCFSMAQKLQARDLILREDQERIINLLKNESRKDAAFYLLDTVPRYKEDWYPQFIEILVEDGLSEIAEDIDPKLFGNIKRVKTEESEDVGNCDQRSGNDIENSGIGITVQTGEYRSLSIDDSVVERTEKHSENIHEKIQNFIQKVDYRIEEQNKQLVLLNEKVDKITGMLQTLIEK